MSEQNDHNNKEPLLLDHSYDGIQEFDNPLPNWWLMTFWGTVVFGVIYWVYYTFGGAPTFKDELALEMQALPQVGEVQFVEADLEAKQNNPQALEAGKAVYMGRCAPCHGAEGQGVIGPNLADFYWLHGQGNRVDIAMVIAKGVLEKGMPAWAEQLSEGELVQVAGFVYSLKGTNPANPKPPQGNEFK